MQFYKLLPFVLTFYSMTILGQEASNQNKAQSTTILKTNLLGVFTLLGEHAINKNMSFQLGLMYQPQNILNNDFEIKSIAPEVRYYLKEPKLKALYLGAYIKAQQAFHIKNFSKARINSLALGPTIGYQWIATNKIAIDVFGGIGYTIYKNIEIINLPDTFNKNDYSFDKR